jgi:hypothetical protein
MEGIIDAAPIPNRELAVPELLTEAARASLVH